MVSQDPREVLDEYLEKENLRRSEKRSQILEVFLDSTRHLTADELYRQVSEKHPEIGQATVYRALNLFVDAGICRALHLEEGATRYELLVGHEHHDHLVCTECGLYEEVVSPRIEELQEELAGAKGFKLKKHRLVLYGICSDCQQ